MFNSIVLKKPKDIPDLPGSYQFIDGEGRIIYVGKAKSLKNRVGSYFQDYKSLHVRTRQMLQTAESVEWITVRSDTEATLLEYSLIKQYKPRFNVRLVDDKSYPYLVLTMSDEWPRASVVREAFVKGNRYFGPFVHAYAIRKSLDVLLRSFPVRTCSDNKLQRHTKMGKPCLLYDIKKCSGPCINAVSKQDYRQMTDGLGKVFDGNSGQVIRELEAAMAQASANLEFELAAGFRDGIEAVKLASQDQEIVGTENEEFDIVGIKDDDLEAAAQVLHIRRGRVVGRRGLILEKVEPLQSGEVSQKVLERLYLNTPLETPGEIFVNFLPSDKKTYEDLLTSEIRQNRKVVIKRPERGRKRTLLNVAVTNAEEQLKRHRNKRSTDLNSRSRALEELQKYLHLKEAPLRIECYDMSHLQGSDYVGSMVVMEDGLLKKSDYRRYKVSAVKGNDDFGAMAEVLTRRLSHLVAASEDESSKDIAGVNDNSDVLKKKDSPYDFDQKMGLQKPVKRFAYKPNLILLDGGKGQLSVGVKVAEDLGLTDSLELAALAKRYEEVYRPGNPEPMAIPRNCEAIFLLQQIRDEAHRFAIGFHRELRAKRMKSGVLDNIAGLGEARKKKLLLRFGGVTKLKSISREELELCTWLPQNVRQAVWEKLHRMSAYD